MHEALPNVTHLVFAFSMMLARYVLAQCSAKAHADHGSAKQAATIVDAARTLIIYTCPPTDSYDPRRNIAT